MITETANLATARNVVKRASRNRNVKAVSIIKELAMASVSPHLYREQTAQAGCLTVCLSGKQHRTPLYKLPARGDAE